jgi:hypothetical protein
VKTLAVALALTALVGCGAPAPTEPAAGCEISTTSVLDTPPPVGLEMPTISVKTATPLVPLGIDDDQHMEVPEVTQPEVAGWFRPGRWPGEVGRSVIAAHVNGGGRPGLFARLHELTPGSEIFVDRADGSRLTFRVARVDHFDKDAFPTREVYGDAPNPQLVLITCGGEFDTAAQSYTDNTIVWSDLTPTD